MSLFSRRTIAALAIASVAAFPAVASAGTAHAHTTHVKKASHSHKTHVKKAAHSQKTRVKKFHAKFVLVGKVKAVDENSVTVTVKGGNLKKGLRGTDVVVAVTETTKVTVDDAQKTLADIAVGDRVAVKGTRARAEGGVTYTAKRVHVKDAETDSVSTPAPATATPTS